MAEQSYLEKIALDKRGETIVRNDYNKEDEYSVRHSDALSNGDPQGKGTGMGGHTFSVPDHNKTTGISYSNFDTINGGGLYDIEGRNGVGGRNFLMTISKYNREKQYGKNAVDTSANRTDGQISI